MINGIEDVNNSIKKNIKKITEKPARVFVYGGVTRCARAACVVCYNVLEEGVCHKATFVQDIQMCPVLTRQFQDQLVVDRSRLQSVFTLRLGGRAGWGSHSAHSAHCYCSVTKNQLGHFSQSLPLETTH